MQNLESEKVKGMCLLFNKFLIQKFGMPGQLFEEADRLIEKAFNEKNGKVLKAAENDVLDQLRHMPIDAVSEFRSLLKKELNIDLDSIEKIRLKAMQKIFRKGKVTTPEEYRLLLDRVDEIYADPQMQEELVQLNLLLADYHP